MAAAESEIVIVTVPLQLVQQHVSSIAMQQILSLLEYLKTI